MFSRCIRLKRGLTRHEDELATLLEVHIGRAGDQVGCHAMGNRPERAHAARDDDHAAGEERPAGDARREVRMMVIDQAAGRKIAEDQGVESIECQRQVRFPAAEPGPRWG